MLEGVKWQTLILARSLIGICYLCKASVVKCRGAWVVGRGCGSGVWAVGVGKCRGFFHETKIFTYIPGVLFLFPRQSK